MFLWQKLPGICAFRGNAFASCSSPGGSLAAFTRSAKAGATHGRLSGRPLSVADCVALAWVKSRRFPRLSILQILLKRRRGKSFRTV